MKLIEGVHEIVFFYITFSVNPDWLQILKNKLNFKQNQCGWKS